MRKEIIFAILAISLASISITSISAQSNEIPTWVKSNAKWWSEGTIDDGTFVSGIKYLITENIIVIPPTTQTEISDSDEIPAWIKNTVGYWANDSIGDSEFLSAMQYLIKEGIMRIPQTQIDPPTMDIDAGPSDEKAETTPCSGDAGCISGTVTQIIDGDTIKVDGQSIRFALVDAPKIKHDGGKSRNFLEVVCPVGSEVIVDQDDKQLEDKYGRILGVIYCNDMNLNKELLDSGLGDLYSAFCDQSEFSTHSWAVKHGCEISEDETTQYDQECDPSYPDFCIPPPPPDLDCGDIPQKNFTVLQPDPHRFDGDKDGIGCES